MLWVKSGETEKLAILFERYKQNLFAYFFRLTRDHQSSEDLVQNVFMRILKYRQKFSGYGSFTAWMYQIAHNVFVDHTRKNNRYKEMPEMLEAGLEDDFDHDAHYIQKENLQMLDKALNKLGKDKREILILSKYQGLKYKEIGKILNCSEGNVKIKVFRALNELKDIYLQMEDINHG